MNLGFNEARNEMQYEDFLKNKRVEDSPSGFEPLAPFLDEKELKPFQRSIIEWACRRGRAAVFADTGFGKSRMQVAWAEQVHQYTGNRVLILAPLCVAQQTVAEAQKIGVTVKYRREFDHETGIYITNYEMLDAFEEKIKEGYFDGIVIDESSILKNQDGKTRERITRLAENIPYRLSCTATPSPNDHMELGTQAEFLGIMTSKIMLSMFFTHDSGEVSKWRLKGHGQSVFWEWLSSWAVFVKKPSDLGFDDAGYDLPALEMEYHAIGEAKAFESEGGLVDRHKAKRETVDERVKLCADLVNQTQGSVVVWCHRNDESEKLYLAIPGSVEVSGSDSLEAKEEKLDAFRKGEFRVLVTKPKIAGFGMNWQFCNETFFVGLSDSYEQIYQAIRRFWRFGQTQVVTAHFVAHAAEGPVLENIKRKEAQANEMARELIGHMKRFQEREVKKLEKQMAPYQRAHKSGEGWDLYLGDCVDVARELKDQSIDFSVFSPPFASLYTYSNSERDFGNSRTYSEFWNHFGFLAKELFRALRNGRNIAVHCMNLPMSKTIHGEIGIQDFRGDLIRMFQSHGFVFCSEAMIWKDPVVAMQRTKALGLLWKQIKKDSTMSRMGIPDYILTFRKPGLNTKPISHTPEEFPVNKWQHYASPCWFDIKQSNTLNRKLAREEEDERHIAPLQLDVIQRCLEMWSAKDDLVFSPFAGIGSEGFVSLQMGRRFVGSELKPSYFELAGKNLSDAKCIPLENVFIPESPRDAATSFHQDSPEQSSIFEYMGDIQ